MHFPVYCDLSTGQCSAPPPPDCNFTYDFEYGTVTSQYSYSSHTLEWSWRESPFLVSQERGMVDGYEVTKVNEYSVEWKEGEFHEPGYTWHGSIRDPYRQATYDPFLQNGATFTTGWATLQDGDVVRWHFRGASAGPLIYEWYANCEV